MDRLLALPHYGERWGRHWLDVARYADSNGMDENTAFGNAHKYRDYVVRAFDEDKPFDRFVKEQLAGDLLTDGYEGDRLAALGFLALGPKVLAEPDKQKMLLDIADEQLDTTGKAFLGLSLGCARCHDHKFDPLPTRDYNSLLGVFTSTRTMQNLNTVAKTFERTGAGGPVGFYLGVEDGSAAAYGTQPRNLFVQVRGNYLTAGEEAPPVFPRILAGETQTPFVGKSVSGGTGFQAGGEREAIRDSMLAVAGTLDRTVGGTLYAGANLDYVGDVRYDTRRRSLYLPVIRGKLFDFFQTFDFPDPCVTVGHRVATTVAPQALFLMNNPFATARAAEFARRIAAGGKGDAERVAFAYRQAYCRAPTADEAKRTTAFVTAYVKQSEATEKDEAKRTAVAWTAFAQALFASSEFAFTQ